MWETHRLSYLSYPPSHPPVYFLAAGPEIIRLLCSFPLRLSLLICVSISILLACLKALYGTLLVLNGSAELETMLKLNCADTISACPPGIDDETPKL